MQVLIQEVWSGAQDSTSLTSSQMMLRLLDHGLCFEYKELYSIFIH